MLTASVAKGSRWWPCLAMVISLGCVFAAVARAFVQRYQIATHSVAGIYCCFVLMIFLMVAPGVSGARDSIRDGLIAAGKLKVAITIFILCLPYLIYAAGTGDWKWSALVRILAVAAFVPMTYEFFPVRNLQRFEWQDLTVAVFLIAALMSRQLNGIWNVPVNLDFMTRLFLIGVGSWSWTFFRQVPELGYAISFSPKVLRAAAWNFALFAVIAIPASLAIGFTHWHPGRTTIAGFCVSYLEIFLFIALLEEMFFRGFLQTLLSKTLNSALGGQMLVSCLFGLFHILHKPFPNWKYVLLATVAGWFYGTAFIRGGNLMASALTHAMVDAVWRAFF